MNKEQMIKKYKESFAANTQQTFSSLEAKNDARNESYVKAEQKHSSELKTVYNAMRDANRSFTCHDINNVLQSGTNIASRIFKSLENAGLIKCVGTQKSELNTTVTAYIVINSDVEFDSEKIKMYNKKTVEERTILNKINEINEILLKKNLIEIGLKTRQKIAAQMMLVINAKVQDYNVCADLFSIDNKNIDLKICLNKILELL